jgi:hypothetical protein
MDAPVTTWSLSEEFKSFLGEASGVNPLVAPVSVMTVCDLARLEFSIERFSLFQLLKDYGSASAAYPGTPRAASRAIAKRRQRNADYGHPRRTDRIAGN